MFLVKVIFLGILLEVSVESTYLGENDDVFQNLTLKESYQSMVKKLHQYLKNDFSMDSLVRQLALNNSDITVKCINQFLIMSKAQLISDTHRAFSYSKSKMETSEQLIDASFKPNPGILRGNINWMGNYRECMKTDGLHYCTMTNVVLNIGQLLPITLGMCMPEQCGPEDVTEIFVLLSNLTRHGNTSFIIVYENEKVKQQYGSDAICYDKKTSYSNGVVVMITVSFLIVALCIMGTLTESLKGCCVRKEPYNILVDPVSDPPEENDGMPNNQSQEIDEKKPQDISMHGVTVSDKNSFMVNFLLCFSVIKNTKAVLNTDVPKGSITAINGMRTLSITWVVLGHALAFALQYIDDAVHVLSWMKWFSFQAILNATVSVDSFFFLSGLLVSYLSMKRFKAKGTLPLVRYYLHRYIRLTPSYAYLLFLSTYIGPILGSGPNWYLNGPDSPQSENCISYWWTNLLYINNLYPKQENMCFGVSWYLANDMQFYVISPIILFAMYKLRWIGVTVVNGILIVACCVINGVLIYHYNASATIYIGNAAEATKPDSPIGRYMKYIYMKPYTRIATYLIGLILGYIISYKYTINGIYRKYIYLAGWVFAIGFGLAVVYGPYSQTQYTWKMVEWIIYGVMFRIVWAIALAWVIFACHNGWGGYIDKFLSWRAFIPLSRLTYGVYLIHAIILFWYYASAKTLIDMSIFQLIIIFVATTVLSFMGAFVTAVCIEYPVFNLEKLIEKQITSRKKSS